MFSFRGDAHKLYLHLRNAQGNVNDIKFIRETNEIRTFYQTLDTDTLRLIYYRTMKEKNGSGIIPIFATAIPWLLFLLANPLEEFLFSDGNLKWIIFIIIYLIILTISLLFHFKERAWAVLHAEIIQDIIVERKDDK
ncbi:hypothetical protein [Ornithinibacillus halophilus]|uniref:Uncharacterized protein n=1 Tax=Ornithinibacillus halophilus TaxID=930117 RepID=A0A1M5L9R2_9BACI|nr:hypothetical protein [Ornithinibacillus halophilus]SHG61700.1 hypothetical protein SAMN05216225_104521 [Ornithinibacillus halophilus]